MKKQKSSNQKTDTKPNNMDDKRWEQHLAWKKVMAEGQSTPDTTWLTSSKNLYKNE